MSDKTNRGGAWTMLLDYGPLLVFFAAYKLAGSGLQGTLVATAAFMVAVVVAIVIGLVVLGRVSPMVWLSAMLILGFGGITLYFHDPRFIQMKPTIIYLMLAGALFIGLMRGKALLHWLFGPIFPGLSETGWLKLSRNWAFFFLALAATNEVLRREFDFSTWLTIKVWGLSLGSMLFAIANMPMLLRHGLDPEAKAQAIEKTPVE